MALLHRLRFLGPLPTLSRLGQAPLPVRATPPVVQPEVVVTEAAEERDWRDPDVPLDDLRAELERRGEEVNPHWNRVTLLKRLEGE